VGLLGRVTATALTAVSAAIVAAAFAAGTALGAAHPPAPTARDQPLTDGCQRSDLGLGFD
jgi:hypothetical protein